jgi:prepilin-type N-terminal cleavage/methylation domain-containing protein
MIRTAIHNKKGLTLVELLVVLAIISTLSVGLSPKIINFYNRYSLDADFQDLIQVIRLAETKAMQSEGSSPYSVHFVTGNGGSFTLFRGSNFSGRDSSYDEVHILPTALNLSLSIGSSTDIIFSKYEATTTNTGTITLSWPDGNLTKAVSVNSYGVLTKQ